MIDDILQHEDGFTEVCLSEIRDINSFDSQSLAMSNFERAAYDPAPLPPPAFTSPDIDSPLQAAAPSPLLAENERTSADAAADIHVPGDENSSVDAEYASVDINASGSTGGAVSLENLEKGIPISQLFAQAFNLVGGSGFNSLDYAGSGSDEDEEGSELLKSLAFGSLSLDKSALQSMLSSPSSVVDVSAALRRVLVIAPGYTQQAQDIVGQSEVTIVEVPTNMMFGNRTENGYVSESDSDWQRLTRASVNLLAGGSPVLPGQRQREPPHQANRF